MLRIFYYCVDEVAKFRRQDMHFFSILIQVFSSRPGKPAVFIGEAGYEVVSATTAPLELID